MILYINFMNYIRYSFEQLKSASEHSLFPFLLFLLLTLLCVKCSTRSSKRKNFISCQDMEELKRLEDCKALRTQLIEARQAIRALIKQQSWTPVLLRLAWSDAASYNRHIPHWPEMGGANGSIRREIELDLPLNAGLDKGIQSLRPLKVAYPRVSWADLIQMAGALAVESSNGPTIHMRYGRVDAHDDDEDNKVEEDVDSNPSLRLPCPCYPFPDQAITPAVHVRNIFSRLGFNSSETVALMGGHTLGRAFQDRTGVTEHASGPLGSTAYTRPSAAPVIVRDNSTENTSKISSVKLAGGQSWTKRWLQFDNSYFSQRIVYENGKGGNNLDQGRSSSNWCDDLLWLPTDDALLQSPEFKSHFLNFARNEEAFFIAYAAAHKKMSELGAKFEPPEGIYLD